MNSLNYVLCPPNSNNIKDNPLNDVGSYHPFDNYYNNEGVKQEIEKAIKSE